MNKALDRALAFLAVCLALHLTIPNAWAAEYRLYPGPRQPTSLRLPTRIPVSGYGLINAFPTLTFNQPIALAAPPGETNRLFIVERGGTIQVISNLALPGKALFLDLSGAVTLGGDEGGLLGLAFHPGFATNGQFFVYLTRYQSTPGSADRLHDVLLRFAVSPDNPNAARPGSETMILAQVDDSDQHNGGDLKFGPDGYLYVSIGERVNRDISWVDQTPIDRDLQGAILRIDVDRRSENLLPNSHPASTEHYRVPADNPWVGATEHHGRLIDPTQVRTELYAIGLRNPWRLAFDPLTGILYAADVGEARQEEINRIEPGGDYGWPYFEGLLSHRYTRPVVFNPRSPLHTYAHGWSAEGTNGNCLIGGVVYRGPSMPWLHGRYLFSDFFSGHIWALAPPDDPPGTERLLGMPIGPSAFGLDPRDGEILITQFFEGTILRLRHEPPNAATDLPASLADTGLFEDLASLTPVPGLVPFSVNSPLWSDHAQKTRWFCLPETNAAFGFDRLGAWTSPTGAVWVKHFEMELTNGRPNSVRRLETRVLVNASDGYYGATYRWGESLTNAWLVPEEGAAERLRIYSAAGDLLREQTWRYPSRADCLNCHTKWGGRALGFNTHQLNRPSSIDPGTNQITALAAAGYVQPSPATPEAWPALSSWDDPSVPVEFRVRSYLQANCVSCHVPGGSGWRTWDARITTPLAFAAMASDPGVITPGDLGASKIYQRLQGYPHLMPPIGTSVINSNALGLIANWIVHWPPHPWSHFTVGNALHPGGSLFSNGVFHVSGTGRPVTNVADSFHFLHRPFDAPAAQFIIRQVSQTGVPGGLAGLMAREGDGTNESDRFIFASLDRDQTAWIHRRDERGGIPVFKPIGSATMPQWWRAVRHGDVVDLFRSDNGTDWIGLGSDTWSGRSPLRIGLAVNSGSDTAFEHATFDSASFLAITLTNSGPSTVRQPATIALESLVTFSGRRVAWVEFYHGAEKIGELSYGPYRFTVSNLWAGRHLFFSRAVDEAGDSVNSRPLEVVVEPYPATVGVPMEDPQADGDWLGKIGAAGYVLAGSQTNLPASVDFALPEVDTIVWSDDTTDRRAPQRPGFASRVAAAWTSPAFFTLRLGLRDGHLHRVSFYFLDWETINDRVQRLEFNDPASGRTLLTQTISNFTRGVSLTIAMRGEIDLRVTALADPGPVLTAVFFDKLSLAPPRIALLSPTNGQAVLLPAALDARIAILEPGTGIAQVEYQVNGQRVADARTAPFQLDLTGLTDGTHVLQARAYDSFGEYADSEPVTFHAVLPPARAAFLEEDQETLGNWSRRFGSNGHLMPIQTNWPPALPVAIPDAQPWSHAVGTDPAYLEWPGRNVRTFSFYYAEKALTAEFQLADGRPRTIAAYFYDVSHYPQTVRILDPATGKILDTRSVTNGLGGRYLLWSVQGRVSLQVTNPYPGIQARLNGLFLGPLSGALPEVSLVAPADHVRFPIPAKIRLAAEASAPDGLRAVEFHTATERLGAVFTSPYELLWEYPAAGDYAVFARAVSRAGAMADSAAVNVRLTGAGSTQARFVQADGSTLGNWQPRYGNVGYWVAGYADDRNIPLQITLSQTQHVAQLGFSTDPAALTRPGTVTRNLAFWVGEKSGRFLLRIDDGRPRRVSLYNYAPGWTNAVTVNLRAATTGAALDSRTILSQNAGTYLTWDIWGAVEFEFVTPGSFSFLNGIFIDETPDPYLEWERRRFSVTERAEATVSGEQADPDGDGYQNWAEFLLNRNPGSGETLSPLQLIQTPDGIFLHLFLNKTAPPDAVHIVSSLDLLSWSEAREIQLEQIFDRGDTLEWIYRVTSDSSQSRFLRLQFAMP